MADASDAIVIEAASISKQFRLNRFRAGDLRELVMGIFRPNAPESATTEAFFALRDVSFTIQRGEAVGIVGHNGSGKSTLLKMLTGIMKPDTGRLATHGRIGALIEVGAGFHPDMSGRENIFLNGSILGLSRKQIEAKFDEIVAFSGLERFIDTPVKRYSSGMYMRLGFAIATHVDPDILLIDEVLAVGDTQFQRKCLRRLQEYRDAGGTVVFVSHSMGQVAELCQRCLWLDRGMLLHDGRAEDAIDRYMAVVADREDEEFKKSHPEEWALREAERRHREEEESRREQERLAEEERRRTAEIEAALLKRSDPARGRVLYVRLTTAEGERRDSFETESASRVEVTYRFEEKAPRRPVVAVDILRVSTSGNSADDTHIFTISNYDHGIPLPAETGDGCVCIDYARFGLMAGDYRLRVNLFPDSTADQWWDSPDDTVDDAAQFRVTVPISSPGVAYIPTRVRWESTSQIQMRVYSTTTNDSSSDDPETAHAGVGADHA